MPKVQTPDRSLDPEQPLPDVEHGETISGILPETEPRRAETSDAIARIMALRSRMSRVSVEEILSAKNRRVR